MPHKLLDPTVRAYNAPRPPSWWLTASPQETHPCWFAVPISTYMIIIHIFSQMSLWAETTIPLFFDKSNNGYNPLRHKTYSRQHTFVRCNLTRLRLCRVCSLDATLCLSSARLHRKPSNDCAVLDSTGTSLLAFQGVLFALTVSKSERCGVDKESSAVAVSFSLSQCSGEYGVILAAGVDWLVVRQGRFGVVPEVPYRLQRLRLKLWLIYTHRDTHIKV